MRFDVSELGKALGSLSSNLSTTVAAVGVSLASVMVGYVVLFGGDRSAADTDVRTTTVAVVAEPVFKPAIVTPVAKETAAEEPAAKTPSPRPQTQTDAERAPPPEGEREIARAVQAALKDAGCYRGKVNGRWTPMTSAAMDEFTMRVNARLPVDKPDPVLLTLLETHDDVSCRESDVTSPRKTETARTEQKGGRPTRDRPTMKHEATLTPTAAVDEPSGAEHLSFAGPGWQRRESEAAHARRTAAIDDAEAEPEPVARAPRKATKRKKRARRKYRRKKSFSREVKRSFRSIQRSLNRIF